MKKVVFTFGRYNPPTTGHAELITYAVRLAQRTGAEHRIYTSQSHDPSKNPLSPRQKITFLRQIFPGVNFVADPSMRTAFDICKKLTAEGYEDVTFVVGDDRVAEFSRSLGKYVKPKTAKDFNPKIHYPFKKFQVVSSGGRKEGISGTALRAAVRKGDFATFAKASAARDKTLARKIFDATRSQLKEEVEISEVTAREMHKHLTSKGWSLERKGKSHDLYSHPKAKNGRRITLPRHPGELDRRLQKEIDKQTDRYLREEMSRSEFKKHLNSFIDFTCDKLDIKEKPKVFYKDADDQGEQPSFGGYAPGTKHLVVMSKNRHPMDIFRTVAHELVHHKQNEDGRLGHDVAEEGKTGSDIENEANARAGELMRWYGKANPHCFSMSYVTENKAIILSGTPGSGKDKILKEAILPLGFKEVSTENFNAACMTDNLVINGASNYNKIVSIKEELDKHGYETIMVFINTSNIVSKQRNEARGLKGGRVITETVRFAKWKDAQENLDRYDQIFEKVIEIKNDLDLNLTEDVVQETYRKLIDSVSKEISEFAKNNADRLFENMINEVGGAGNWGTQKQTDKYASDTPGQSPGKPKPMKVLKLKKKMKEEDVKVFGNLPDLGDRLGPTYTSAKNPSFVGDITGDQNTFIPMEPMQKWSAIDRWAMKEETRKRFKSKYGQLAEQKIKETAEKLRKESLTDPFMATIGVTPNTMNQDQVRPDINAEFEKMAIFKRNKRLNRKK